MEKSKTIKYERLIGKTIASISRDPYNTSFVLEFDDGSNVTFSAGKDGCHNENWNTVEYKIRPITEQSSTPD